MSIARGSKSLSACCGLSIMKCCMFVDSDIYPSRIGFRFSEPDFTRTLDLSQLQNPRLSITKPLVLFNRKIKISGKLLS